MTHSYNRLSSETSPYLLQHASNPVNWYPWGDEAFMKAKAENKLMLFSIGYSSCHWCHVMEQEAFSDKTVAEFMNENYVCVKVDREERPDVDQIYMNAVQIITRSGGWPLNCFALPDGRPVFGGTYFPKQQWMDILRSLNHTWVNEPQKVTDVAEELTQGVLNTEIILNKSSAGELSSELLKNYVGNWRNSFDARYGANKGAPKFPMPGSLQFLLDYSWAYSDDYVKNHVLFTLDKMLKGGIYDHLGGGFFRYSVDERWEVPHFEKMLYDNAQLLSLYTHAYKHTGNESYRSAVYQTIDFLRRELRSPEGGFYGAIDADSEGEEGKFYTFTKNDIDNILGDDSELFSVYYGITASGNHLGKNVLREAATMKETGCVIGIDEKEVSQKLKDARSRLFNMRATRVRPITDDKQLLAWNAMAISALTEAYTVFGDKRFLTDALSCIGFIEDKLVLDDGSLNRVYCKGESSISGFLDDYAFLSQAYIALYKSSFDEQWLVKAKDVVELAFSKFFHEESGMFYYTAKDHDNVIVRKMELTDGVIPSSSGMMADVLMILGVYFNKDDYTDKARQLLWNIENHLKKGGPFVYKWAHIYLKQMIGSAKAIASKAESNEVINSISKKVLHPFYVPAKCNPNSKIPSLNSDISDHQFSICIGKQCQKPTDDKKDLIEQINKSKPADLL
ncbi:MAG: thioredoxin domain-containing protein [Bacteroidales bacterium]